MHGTGGEGFMAMDQFSHTEGVSTNGHGFKGVNHYNTLLGGKVGHGYWDSADKDPVA